MKNLFAFISVVFANAIFEISKTRLCSWTGRNGVQKPVEIIREKEEEKEKLRKKGEEERISKTIFSKTGQSRWKVFCNK